MKKLYLQHLTTFTIFISALFVVIGFANLIDNILPIVIFLGGIPVGLYGEYCSKQRNKNT